MARDPRIDAYIAKSAPFAQPILVHLRALVHSAVPDAGEAIKWGMPHFLFRGKIVAAMAAFKAHSAFMIHGDEEGWAETEGMGSFGKITGLADLPSDAVLKAKLADALNRIETSGSAAPGRDSRAPKAEIPVPDDFAAALASVPRARATMDGLAPSHRRDYLEWITGAKQAATRARRIAQAVEWLAEGKRRNWKYETG